MNLCLRLILSFAVFIAASSAQKVTRDVPVEERVVFPYIVKLRIYFKINHATQNITLRKRYACSGVILKNNLILTAAHCLHHTKGKLARVAVIAGREDPTAPFDTEQRRSVRAYMIHKSFNMKKLSDLTRGEIQPNDIVILVLRSPLKINKYVTLANLPTKEMNISDVVGVSAGWGLRECGFRSRILKQVEVKGITKENCVKRYNYYISDDTFCGISLNGTPVASASDSGSPFIYKNEVLGLISFGLQKRIIREDGTEKINCDPEKPVAIIDTFKYKNWIESAMNHSAIKKSYKKKKENKEKKENQEKKENKEKKEENEKKEKNEGKETNEKKEKKEVKE